jgi:S-(hydroxymethyl)glutathione dehydrogenase / alcohol dehydrogenase
LRTKAAILVEQNKPLEIGDLEIPKLGVGQVLVKISYAGICGAQVGEIRGNGGEDKFLPHLMGHEGAGVVVDTGEGVKLKEGNRVVAHWREGKGIDADFPKYEWITKGKTCIDYSVGGGKVTTFQEYSVISENRLTKIKDFIPLEIAATMGCSVTTAFGLINNEAKLKVGQSIMVIGCGGVGLNVVQAASMVGAGEIIAVDVVQGKLNKAFELGATRTSNFIDEWKDIDIVVDTTGISVLVEQGWRATREKMILVGQPHKADTFTFRNARNSFYQGKVMMDSQGGLTNPNVDIPRYLDMGDRIVTESTFYSLEDVNEAIKDMGRGTVVKPMLEMP